MQLIGIHGVRHTELMGQEVREAQLAPCRLHERGGQHFLEHAGVLREPTNNCVEDLKCALPRLEGTHTYCSSVFFSSVSVPKDGQTYPTRNSVQVKSNGFFRSFLQVAQKLAEASASDLSFKFCFKVLSQAYLTTNENTKAVDP